MKRILALLIALAIPRAAAAQTNPFACRTAYIEFNNRLGDKADAALAKILADAGLSRADKADQADLTIQLAIKWRSPPTDGAGRITTAETITLQASIRGDGRPFETSTPAISLSPAGTFSSNLVRPMAAWSANWQAIIGDRLATLLQQFLAEHGAGARIRVEPKEARLVPIPAFSRTTPDGETVLRCRPPQQEITVHAELAGHTDQSRTVVTSTTDTPITLTLQPSASTPKSAPASTPPASPPAAPPTLFGTPSIAHIILAASALGGLAVALRRLRLRPIAPPPAPRRLKVLFLAANPRGTPTLDLAEEIRQIRARISEGDHRDEIDFIPYLAVRFDDVLLALNQHKPQIVHFSGHGQKDGAIILEGAGKEPAPLSPDLARKLFDAFDDGDDRVRLVLLNACFSRAQADAIREVVDVTIGTTRAVTDAAAVSFAAAFYRAVAFGCTARNAYEQGLLGVEGNAGVEAPEHQIELLEKAGISAEGLSFVG